MKLVFSDGSHTVIESYKETFAEVNGVKVPALDIMIDDTRTLENIKTMFGDPTLLRSVSLYTDLNEFIKTYTGYEDRFSINYYGDKCGVVLAKTSDVQQKVEALEKTVEAFNTYLGKVEKTLGSIQKQYEDVKTTVSTDLTQSLKALTETLGTVGGNYENIISDMNLMKQNNINNREKNEQIAGVLDEIKNSMSEYANSARMISNQMGDHVMVANRIQEATTVAQQSASSATEAAELMRSRLAEFNNQTAKVKESNETLARSVEGLSTASKDQEEKLSTASESIEKLSKDSEQKAEELKSMKEAADSVAKDVETLTEGVNEAKNSLEQAQNELETVNAKLTQVIPETDITKMSLEDAKTYRIVESNLALEEFLETHPITSDCHGTMASYSITERKQQYLQAMILTTQLAAANGAEYQPSWNATGEACTYDWTLEQLQQLAMEIEAVVRPLVSKQQHIEVMIRNCSSIEELQGIEIDYNESLAIPGGE